MPKKAVKKTTPKKTSARAKKMSTPVMEPMLAAAPMAPVTTPTQLPRLNSSRLLSISLIILAVALLTYKAGPYFFPAIVGNTPISRFEVWSRLEAGYGEATLDDLINERLLDQAIADSGVKVDQADIDAQLTDLEAQFESLGGLDAALSQRGMSREDLIKQIRTQLSVEAILKDKVSVTDEEVQAAFDESATTTYKDKKFEDVSSEIRENLMQSKLVTAFGEYFEGIKNNTTVKNFGL